MCVLVCVVELMCRSVRISPHLLYLAIKALPIVSGKESKPGEDTAGFGWEGSCSLNPQHHPMKHACNQQGHTSTDSFQPNSSITGKLDLRGPPFWLCTDQPTRTERSISSTLTLTGLQSGNTIHDKLSSNSSWTGSNPFSLFSLCFSPPQFHTERHCLSSDEVMTETSGAVTLTWHGLKISKWRPRKGAPRAVMFQHETRLPLMWSVFWNEESGSFDVSSLTHSL